MTSVPTQLPRPAPMAKSRNMIAVASGKGGVGKTWFAITLTHALARSGHRTLLFDGDLGLANVDIQLGLNAGQQDLAAVLGGRMSLFDAVTRVGRGDFDVIAGRSGSGKLAHVPVSRLQILIGDLGTLATAYDRVVLDIGAGVEQTVRLLAGQAGICAIVATDEPTSLTDAYAFIKLTHLERPGSDMRIVVNLASSIADGERTYETINATCERFLKISPPLLGIIRRDIRVREAIRHQEPLLTRFPASPAACDVEAIAARLIASAVSP
jgi:flagellar biosynthesis protein FlhG